MIPFLDRFQAVFNEHHIELIVPEVRERLEEADLLAYAGRFDGAVCGDDRYTERVLKACAPRLKIISKWGTGIDSIDSKAAARLGIKVARTPMPSPPLWRIPFSVTCWPLRAASPGWIAQ